MNLWGYFLHLSGWTVDITVPMRDKCVICVAPHTSNWDFVLGLSAYESLGREANFLMKESWFFFPLKYLLKAFGGIPVPRRKKRGSLTDTVIEMFRERDYVNLAVTPEGTRSLTDKWHTGFLYIAYGAGVPIQLGIIDYRAKRIMIREEYLPTGDTQHDLTYIRKYYSEYRDAAKYPSKFKA